MALFGFGQGWSNALSKETATAIGTRVEVAAANPSRIAASIRNATDATITLRFAATDDASDPQNLTLAIGATHWLTFGWRGKIFATGAGSGNVEVMEYS